MGLKVGQRKFSLIYRNQRPKVLWLHKNWTPTRSKIPPVKIPPVKIPRSKSPDLIFELESQFNVIIVFFDVDYDKINDNFLRSTFDPFLAI